MCLTHTQVMQQYRLYVIQHVKNVILFFSLLLFLAGFWYIFSLAIPSPS